MEVRIPQRLSENDLNQFLQQSEDWIQKKLSQLNQNMVPKKLFLAGEEFFVLGQSTTLCLTDKAPRKTHYINGAFFTSLNDPEKIKKQITTWYREKAGQTFERRLQHYGEQMGLRHSGLKVKEYSARWGTCFPDGQIALNWRLMMPPMPALDYVVVHELAHLKYNGHGKRFWGLVEKHLPHYKESIKLLGHWNSELYSF